MAKPMWNLSIYITSLSTEKSVEVNGETHVGTLMLNLVEGLGKFFYSSFDWVHKVNLGGSLVNHGRVWYCWYAVVIFHPVLMKALSQNSFR